MKTKLLQILLCPKCQSELTCTPTSHEAGEIKDGHLLCVNNHRYEINNFVPLFCERTNYVKTFEFIRKNPLCDLPDRGGDLSVRQLAEKEFLEQTGFNIDELKGKLILDAGCGGGRFISYLRKHGIEVVGVDLQPGVLRWCTDRLKGDLGIHFIQANLFELPFRENSFDYIYSLGVLHHTPNPKAAFNNLVRYLKKDGRIAIWVYPKKPRTYLSDTLRPITTRLPLSLLFVIGLIVTTVYAPFLKIQKIGRRLQAFLYGLRLPWHQHWAWRIMSFMDWYGPKYQFKFTNEEIQEWFHEAGLTNIKLFAYETSAQGTKPIAFPNEIIQLSVPQKNLSYQS